MNTIESHRRALSDAEEKLAAVLRDEGTLTASEQAAAESEARAILGVCESRLERALQAEREIRRAELQAKAQTHLATAADMEAKAEATIQEVKAWLSERFTPGTVEHLLLREKPSQAVEMLRKAANERGYADQVKLELK